MADTLDQALGFLRCPTCGLPLSRDGKTMTCESAHRFDIARHGYVNLSPTVASAGGDSALMIEHRERFLSGGWFGQIADHVADSVVATLTERASAPRVAEVGAGTGYYLARALDRLPDAIGLALDASSAALRRSSRAHPRIAAVGCDVWKTLPLADHGADILLDIFSPRNPQEFHRALSVHGVLVIVTPTARHLSELTSVLPLLSVDADKEQRMHDSLGPLFDRVSSETLEYPMSLSRDNIADLIGMGPSARHVTDEQLADLITALPEPYTVTSSVILGVYRPRH